MKKLLLITSFLASQLFAVQCTDQQYNTEFDNNRYMFSYIKTFDSSKAFIDKESITYDKKNNKIICWTVFQTLSSRTFGMAKFKWEFNLKNNSFTILTAIAYDCEGKTLDIDNKAREITPIIPGSENEIVLNDLKNYLKIK